MLINAISKAWDKKAEDGDQFVEVPRRAAIDQGRLHILLFVHNFSVVRPTEGRERRELE